MNLKKAHYFQTLSAAGSLKWILLSLVPVNIINKAPSLYQIIISQILCSFWLSRPSPCLSDDVKHLAIPSLNSIHFIAWSTFTGPGSERMDIWRSALLYRLIIIDTMWSEHMYTIKCSPMCYRHHCRERSQQIHPVSL